MRGKDDLWWTPSVNDGKHHTRSLVSEAGALSARNVYFPNASSPHNTAFIAQWQSAALVLDFSLAMLRPIVRLCVEALLFFFGGR